MHSIVGSPKKTRARSKSSGSNNSSSKNADDINLNGENEVAQEAMEVDKPESKSNGEDVSEHDKVEKPTKGRKRKASEMKSDSISEEPRAKEKPTVNEIDNEKETPEELIVAATGEPPSDSPTETDSEVKDTSTSSVNNSTSDITAHDDENTLGKGKRARIPNKRYSDIPLKTSSKLNLSETEIQPALENGEAKEILDSTSSTDASENSGSATASPNVVVGVKLTRAALQPASPASAKRRSNINLNNPTYLKPFNYGWKRELVYRATLDGGTPAKRNGDIYYYTPNGRKVRSMREVSEHLKNKELSLDNFTFIKEPLGLDDPEKEIIRDAKKTTSVTPVIKKLTPKVQKTPKISSPKVVGTPTLPVENEKEPKIKEEKKEPRVKSSSRFGFKVKLPKASTRSKAGKKSIETGGDDLEVGTYPPNWSAVEPPAMENKSRKVASGKKKRKRSKQLSPVVAEVEQEPKLVIDSYLQNVAFGYNTLLYIFQYLKVQDLLRASCVCSMWRDIASHSLLWKTVRMKNSQIHSFEGLAYALQKHGTVHLDLRKMLLPNNGNDDIWQEFAKQIKIVDSLRKIELCRCPASAVEELAVSNSKLEVINAVTIKCEKLSLAPLSKLTNLRELRLKSTCGFSLTSDFTALADLKELTHLSLTSIRDLNKLDLSVIADLTNLESLDLGECTDFPKTFGNEILTRLTKLERLRLEKGQGNCYTFEILDAVKSMPQLEQLELVNFDIKIGFDKALGSCTNIKKLLIIPTYISQSATTNHMVLGGVLRLQSNISHFVWGITLELLRVTELFVDQCEDGEKKDKKEKKVNMGNGDSIPVLKPVPLIKDGVYPDIPPAQDPPQVEILPLPNLQKLLLQSLPTTRVKILKIPFHATWRQSITDTVN